MICAWRDQKENPEQMINELKKRLVLQQVAVLEKPGDAGVFLGKLITRTALGFRIRMGESLVQHLVADFSLQKARPVATPAVRMTEAQLASSSRELDQVQYRQCRRGVGILIYLGHDRADIQFLLPRICHVTWFGRQRRA